MENIEHRTQVIDAHHSYAVDLHCLRCGQVVPYSEDAYLCPVCGTGSGPSDAGILDVRYDYERAERALFDGGRLRSGRDDIFRYLPLLPVEEPRTDLRAGWTPLVEAPRLAAELGVGSLYLKDETRNPSRALKDRATAIGVNRALAQGRTDICCASAGNAAISLAAFAANTGLRAHAFVPHDASEIRLEWLDALGADVIRSEGDYDQAYDEAEAMRTAGWYSRNCAFNPFLVEGKKTCGLEIAEQLDWSVPDVVVSPVGDACTLSGIGKGFADLQRMGRIDRRPRLVGVQAAGEPAMLNLYLEEQGRPPVAEPGDTAAASIDVAHPRNARRLLNELDASDGELLAVEDGEMRSAQSQLARIGGTIAELASASTLTALRHLSGRESLASAKVVLVVTGGRTDEPITNDEPITKGAEE